MDTEPAQKRHANARLVELDEALVDEFLCPDDLSNVEETRTWISLGDGGRQKRVRFSE